MATTRELINKSTDLEQALIDSGGELTPEIIQSLQLLEVSTSDKVDQIGFVLDRLDLSADYMNHKADEYQRLAKACNNATGRIKEMVLALMEAQGKDAVVGDQVTFKRVLSPGRVVIEDESKLDPIYFKTYTDVKVDRARIQDDLKSGMPGIAGAILERSYSLRQSITKPPALDKPKKKVKE